MDKPKCPDCGAVLMHAGDAEPNQWFCANPKCENTSCFDDAGNEFTGSDPLYS